MSGLAARRLGGLLGIVRRSLVQHRLSSAVTAGSLALACGLVMAVFSIEDQARTAFTGAQVSFNAVLGARGSPLQLVLNSIFHLETSPGNVPWTLYQELADDPRVALAVPYALGDSYRGFRIVGTTLDLFGHYEPRAGQHLAFAPPGEPFDPTRREAVLGSFVAQETGLAYGARFHPGHGIVEQGAREHDEEYAVVGVLAPTSSPIDRVIWIPIDGVFRMQGHVLRGAGDEYVAVPGEAVPDEHKEVSAILLRIKGGLPVASSLATSYDRPESPTTLAYPIAQVMAGFFGKLGWLVGILGFVAYLVVAVAAGSVLASLYNTMNERRREFAILRALGARRRIVFTVIVLEAAAIALAGALSGFAVYAGVLAVAGAIVRAQTGIVLAILHPHPILALAPLGMVLLGALSGVVPAAKAYRTDVAAGLVPLA